MPLPNSSSTSSSLSKLRNIISDLIYPRQKIERNKVIDLTSASLIRLHSTQFTSPKKQRPIPHSQSLTLATTTQTYDSEHGPLYWMNTNQVHFNNSLFFIHFHTSHPTNPDKARLATAHYPYKWITIAYAPLGRLGFTESKQRATLFNVQTISNNNNGGGIDQYILSVDNEQGESLLVDNFLSDGKKRAKICGSYDTHDDNRLARVAVISFEYIPLPPLLNCSVDTIDKITLNSIYDKYRIATVRIYSIYRNCFLISKPDVPLSLFQSSSDSGWDIFQVQYCCHTKTIRILDTTNTPLRFTNSYDGIMSNVSVNDDINNGEPFEIEIPTRTGTNILPIYLKSRKGYLSTNRRNNKLKFNSKKTENEQFSFQLCLPSSTTNESKPLVNLIHLPNGTRNIKASIKIPKCEITTAFQVLTDYNNFDKFISDASESEVMNQKSSTEMTIRMVQSHSFLWLTIPMQMILNVVQYTEEAIIHMDLVKGFGVKQYKGVWSVVNDDNRDGIIVGIDLKAATSVPAPGFLVDGLMTGALTESLKEIRQECMRRQFSKTKPE